MLSRPPGRPSRTVFGCAVFQLDGGHSSNAFGPLAARQRHMAVPAPLMELRAVPPGADAHVHRGADNLVRLVGSRLARTLEASGILTPDPDDNTTPCMPHHLLEGILARALSPSDVPDSIQFGTHRLTIDCLSRPLEPSRCSCTPTT